MIAVKLEHEGQADREESVTHTILGRRARGAPQSETSAELRSEFSQIFPTLGRSGMTICPAFVDPALLVQVQRVVTMTADDLKRQLSPLELKRKISVPEAAALNDLSPDTFERTYPHLIKKVSPRRKAV